MPVIPLAEAARAAFAGARGRRGAGPHPGLRAAPARRRSPDAPSRSPRSPRTAPSWRCSTSRAPPPAASSCSLRRLRRVVPVHRWTDPSRTPEALRPCVLTLGNFDGVHRGHRAVLTALVEAGHRLGLPAVAVTFDPHPVAVLRPEEAPELITPGAVRDDLIADTGIDGLLVLDFTTEFAQQTPEDFVRAVFVRGLDARCVVVGMDTRFGYRNSGDVSTLADLGEHFGFEVVALDDVGDGERFSSTVVAPHLRAGEVAEAARILGRPHRVVGTVVHGNHRGRALGYPTANLSADSLGLVPLEGVYAGWLTRLDLARGRARPHHAGRDQRRAPTRPSRPRTAAPSRPTSSTATTSTSTTRGSWSSSPPTSGRRCGSTASSELTDRHGRGRRAVPRAADQDRPRLTRMRASGSERGPAGLSRWARHDVGLYLAAAGASVVGALLVWSATARTDGTAYLVRHLVTAAVGAGPGAPREPGRPAPGAAGGAVGVCRVAPRAARRADAAGRHRQRLAVVDPARRRVHGAAGRARQGRAVPGARHAARRRRPSAGWPPARREVLLGGAARGAADRPRPAAARPRLGGGGRRDRCRSSSRWPACRGAGWSARRCSRSAVVVVALTTPVLSDYQRDRLTSFADPSADPQGSGYQTRQVRLAIGAGGMWGQGFMEGERTQGGSRALPAQRLRLLRRGGGARVRRGDRAPRAPRLRRACGSSSSPRGRRTLRAARRASGSPPGWRCRWCRTSA